MLQPVCEPATSGAQVHDVYQLQDVPTQIVSWARLNTASMPKTHPLCNKSSWEGTGLWILETICYNVLLSQEVLADLLDM